MQHKFGLFVLASYQIFIRISACQHVINCPGASYCARKYQQNADALALWRITQLPTQYFDANENTGVPIQLCVVACLFVIACRFNAETKSTRAGIARSHIREGSRWVWLTRCGLLSRKAALPCEIALSSDYANTTSRALMFKAFAKALLICTQTPGCVFLQQSQLQLSDQTKGC